MFKILAGGLVSPFSLVLAISWLLAPFSYSDDLLDIYLLAQERDAVMGEAQARYGAEHTVVAQGRARFLPTVRLSARSGRNTYATRDAWKYSNGFNSHGYGLNLEQNVLNMEAWYNWKAAKASDQRALATLAQAEQELIMRVATAYFNVLRSQEALTAFQAEETAARTVLDQTQQRLDVGLAAVTDVNEAQASADLARVNSLREERNLNQAKLSLEVLTGSNHDDLDPLAADFPIVSAQPEIADSWVDLATASSPAIQVAQFDYNAKVNEAKSLRSLHLPTLTLSASFNDQSETANNIFAFTNAATNNTSVQVNLNFPLFTGGLNSARKRQAYYSRDASEYVLVRVKRETERNVRDSFIGIELDMQSVAARQQAIVSARSALQAVEAGAQIGTRNTVDVVQAQRTLYAALRDYAAARYDYVIDTLKLKQAAGVLTPDDVRSLNEWLR